MEARHGALPLRLFRALTAASCCRDLRRALSMGLRNEDSPDLPRALQAFGISEPGTAAGSGHFEELTVVQVTIVHKKHPHQARLLGGWPQSTYIEAPALQNSVFKECLKKNCSKRLSGFVGPTLDRGVPEGYPQIIGPEAVAKAGTTRVC